MTTALTAERRARSNDLAQSEKKVAVAEAQSVVWSDAFHTIFRNTVVRENTSRSVSLMHPQGYSTVQPESGLTERTVE